MCPVFLFLFLFFLNPTIEVVSFRLRGWCMLGVFLSLAFGHECQDLLSPCDGMLCRHRLDLGEWSQNPC